MQQALPTEYQNFIHLSRYARFDPIEGRREIWPETVDRYLSFFHEHISTNHDTDLASEMVGLRSAILETKAMPSMRAFMTAGPALARDHIAGYNCAYRAIDGARAFDEILFVLMCGTGVGFSVERQLIKNLPPVPPQLHPTETTILVRDSKLGWAKALKQLIAMLYAGEIPEWDTSQLRPAGAILKTFGGRASGPGPLEDLFGFVVSLFKGAVGRRLNSLECHDLVCKIGECVVSGGVRRSALLSLSNLSDERMRDAKAGDWTQLDRQRALANNSVAYTEKPEVGRFMEEWLALYKSKSGERGMFNREAARVQAMKFGRRKGYWDQPADYDPSVMYDPPLQLQEIDFGTNPCSEIILRSEQFCNLTEVVARADDDKDSLADKVRMATIMGTMQSTLTDFRYIGDGWKTNCEEERLLGVSITGIMDCPLLNQTTPQTAALLRDLREYHVEVNREYAERLGINPAAAGTCVKPSGTVSQLVDASSGMHSRHSEHYVRRVRMDIRDPLAELMADSGLSFDRDYYNRDHTLVFDFPIKAPEGAILRDDRTAMDELAHWKMFQDNWCEHKPSVTVTVREDEWPEIGGWAWRNFDQMSGVSFLPHSEHTYVQAPYEEIPAELYEELAADQPEVAWGRLPLYEQEDNTVGQQELACTAGACEIL